MDLQKAERFLGRFTVKDRDSHKRVPFVFKKNQKIIHATAAKQQEEGKPIRIVVDKARRVGVSSWSEGIGFCHCCWLPGSHFLIAAHEFKSSKALFQIPKNFAKQAKFLNLRDVEREITFPHEDADGLMQIVTAGKDTSGPGSRSPVSIFPKLLTIKAAAKSTLPFCRRSPSTRTPSS
jgi:hypothetical protein